MRNSRGSILLCQTKTLVLLHSFRIFDLHSEVLQKKKYEMIFTYHFRYCIYNMAFSSKSTNTCDQKIKIYSPCYPLLPPPSKKEKKQPTLRQYYVSCCCCRSFMQENLSYKYCHHYARQIRK